MQARRVAAESEFPLLSREDELGVFAAARRRGMDEGPRFLLVFGEAGVGKTRLVGEFARSALAGDVVTGRAVDYATTPYAPFSELLRRLDALEPTVLARRPDVRAAMTEILASGPRADSGRGPAGKDAAFDACIDALRLFAARRTFTLVLEDMQWSDLASLELLLHIALVAHDAPLLFVVTARDAGADDARAKMLERLGALPRVERMRLDVLEEPAAAALVDEELRRSRRVLGTSERRAVLAAAGGNPLYLRELTRHYATHSTSGDTLPTSLTASLRLRLRAFAPDEQRVLRAAAVVVEFDEDVLARVAGVSSDRTASALRSALDAGILAPPADVWHGMGFSHELIRRTFYTDTLPAERRRLHRAMVAELDSQPQLDPDFSLRAGHAFAAGDHAAAALANERAGDAASIRFAFADAAEFYRRAAEAGASGILDKEAQALERAGRPVAALPLLRRLLGDLGAGADAAVQAGILIRIARAEVRAARRDAALDAIRRAKALLKSAPPSREHFGVHVFDAWLAAAVLDAAGILDALAAAEPYRELGDLSSSIRAYEAAGTAYGLQRDLERWRASYEGMVTAAEMSGDVLTTIGAIANFGNSAFGLGRTELAIALHARALDLAESSRRAELVPYVFATAAWTALAVGDLPRARRLVDRTLPYCSEFPASEVIAAAVGVSVALAAEDDPLLERCYREKVFEEALRAGAPWQIVAVLPAVAGQLLALGRRERARDTVARAVARLTSLESIPEIALVAVDCGLEREYPQLLGWLEAEASKRPNTVGFLHIYRARLARSGTDRERYARSAVSAFAEAGYRLWNAAALEVAGDTAAAVAVYEECGAVRDVRRLSARGHGDAPRSINSLTKREAQVAALAAQGLSNREIGDKLSLSDRTVEHHLSAVFAKVGVRSRVELAARRPERIS